jgi:POT family proton-dependent oligopeptide transporter
VRVQRGDPRKVAVILLLAAPVALALVSRAAPVSVSAMMIGSYYLGLAVGGIVSGWLAL